MDSNPPLVSLEDLSKDYPLPGPMRLRRMFSRFGGLHIEDGVAADAISGQELEDDDEDEDEAMLDDDPGDADLLHGQEDLGRRVIDRVTLRAEGAAVVALVGPEGAGKTVLLKLIAGIVPPSEGRVVVRGTVAPALNVMSLVLPAKGHTVKTALPALGGMVGVAPQQVRSRFDDIGELMESPALLTSSTSLMESRRKRELVLALALCCTPDILLLDIPLRHDAFGDRCLQRINELRAGGTLVVAEMRELRTTRLTPDRVVGLAAGRLVEAAGAVPRAPGSG